MCLTPKPPSSGKFILASTRRRRVRLAPLTLEGIARRRKDYSLGLGRVAEKGAAQERTTRAQALPDGLRLDAADEMRNLGFPARISTAFADTCQQTGTVVMSRVPGKTATTLIAEGYDLKSYFIKAKSCDWGPMAGFVCRHPAFNKSGYSRLEFNLKKHLHYLQELARYSKLWDRAPSQPSTQEVVSIWELLRAGNSKDKVMPVEHSLDNANPFIPIRISNARKEALQGIDWLEAATMLPGGRSIVAGTVLNGNSTVLAEVLVLQNTGKTHWDVYHGRVFVRESGDKPFEFYEVPTEETEKAPHGWPDSKDEFLNPKPLGGPVTDLFEFGLRAALEGKLGTVTQGSTVGEKLGEKPEFRRTHGLQNPFPTYKSDADRHKNAISGDYDLFAVWPATTLELHTADLLRRSERKCRHDVGAPGLFAPVLSKPLAVRSKKTPNLLIEVIPHFAEIELREDPYKGNLSFAVELVVQTFNSLVSAIAGQSLPNRAFHSDEGGRPGIDEIEFPIAVYLPRDVLQKRLTPKVFRALEPIKRPCALIETPLQFLQITRWLAPHFVVTLQHGWVAHLCALVVEEDSFESLVRTYIDDKGRRWFASRRVERENAPEGQADSMRQVFDDLFGSTDDASRKIIAEAFIKIALPPFNTANADERLDEVLRLTGSLQSVEGQGGLANGR
jgi:hypothetical protein